MGPLDCGYLNDNMSAMAAAEAMQELTGVSFGPRAVGLSGYPTPEIVAALGSADVYKEEWPQCRDCRRK